MTAGTVISDVPGRSRISGASATQVQPLSLTQGTAFEWVGSVVGSITQVFARAPSEDDENAPTPAHRQELRIASPEAVEAVVTSARLVSTRATAQPAAWQEYVRSRLGQMLLEARKVEGHPGPTVLLRAWVELGSLLEQSSPTPSIIPSEGSSVAIVWHKGGWDVEIEVAAHDSTVWAHRRTDGAEWYGSLAENRSRLTELLRDMAV